MQKIKISTFFDCTATGVKSYRKTAGMSEEEWNYQRNQQRNWETFLQCISLRCQPLNINGPYNFSFSEGQLYWEFTFETDRADIFLNGKDPIGLLKEDCNGVPMIIGLSETQKELFFTPYIVSDGEMQNTVFELVENK